MDRKALKAAAKESVAHARGNSKLVTGVFLVAVVLMGVLEWGLTVLVERAPANGAHYLSQAVSTETRTYVLVTVVSLIFQFLLLLTALGYGAVSLRLGRDRDFSLDTLLEGFRMWSRGVLLYVYISLLVGLLASLVSLPVSYVLSGLLLAGYLSEGMVFNLLAVYTLLAMAVISYRYRMVYFLLLDQPETPVRVLASKAAAMNRPHRISLFLLDLSFAPWVLLCLLTCGILFVWKLPYMAATYAHAYAFMEKDYEARQQRMEALLEAQKKRMEETGLFRR